MRHLVVDDDNIAEQSFSSLIQADHSNREILDEASSEREIVVNIATLIEDVERRGEKKFSLELFPTKKVDKFYERFFSQVSLSSSPLFYSLTWHHDHATDENYLPLEILRDFPNNTLLHLAARKLKRVEVVKILDDVILQGKTNILALRGDDLDATGDFVHAVDLIKFVRNRYDTRFSICVAGYPQMHPESINKQMDLMYLKEKVNAGASFIISQIFFESKLFTDFVKSCRSYDINVSIIAGIFPIQNYKTLRRMAKLCRIEIPPWLINDLEPIRDNDEAVRAYGIALARNLITEIIESGAACVFHLFTLNSASTAMDVCEKLFD